MKLSRNPDVLACSLLVALWLLFFWRLFTPVTADQASLKQGDFSGQFVAFAAYQYDRLSEGQVPLWNPYNNGGMPFIADTQAAVFYPPRLITLAVSRVLGGFSYHALELEMTAHVLAYTLLMYALVRRITRGQRGSVFAGLASAIIAGYSGFTSGYPPLQLALLEAAIWLPAVILGIHEATRVNLRWRWMAFAGAMLGLSWQAGHPQTSYFLTLLAVAYFGFRMWRDQRDVRGALVGLALLAGVSFGLAAVQLLPGFEYLTRTARSGFGYDAKSNGFPIQDVLQFAYPGIVSLFSPLYISLSGLMLAGIGLWRRPSGAVFWGIIALLALLWSFGGNSVLYPLLYNILPGLRFFRGQERAAFLVMNSLAILAGLGMVALVNWDEMRDHLRAIRLRLWSGSAFRAFLAFGALVAVAWLGNPASFGPIIGPVTLTTIAAAVLMLLIPFAIAHPERWMWRAAWIGLIVIELFTINLDASAVYDSRPPADQLSMTPPPLVAAALEPPADQPFRVDGFRGLTNNFGSLYGLADIRGISPLFLDSALSVIEPEKINPLAWELFAVRDVYTDWAELPVPSTIVAAGTDSAGEVNLHRLTNPRPFALLATRAALVGGDAHALELLRDPAFQPRLMVILDREPPLTLPENADPDGSVRVIRFAPEQIDLEVDAATNALVSISMVHYPGWQAFVDGQPAEILRAYGGMIALAVPAGSHQLTLIYQPLSYALGSVLTLTTLAGLALTVLTALRPAARKESLR